MPVSLSNMMNYSAIVSAVSCAIDVESWRRRAEECELQAAKYRADYLAGEAVDGRRRNALRSGERRSLEAGAAWRARCQESAEELATEVGRLSAEELATYEQRWSEAMGVFARLDAEGSWLRGG